MHGEEVLNDPQATVPGVNPYGMVSGAKATSSTTVVTNHHHIGAAGR